MERQTRPNRAEWWKTMVNVQKGENDGFIEICWVKSSAKSET